MEVPPAPLFKDEMEKNLIPQVITLLSPMLSIVSD